MVQGPWYYPARYLHIRTRPRESINVEPPPLTHNLEGSVRILLFINERGGLDSYRIVSSTPDGVFDKSVTDAFTHVGYEPGLIANLPVKSQLLIEVVFHKDGSIGTEVLGPENP
jgi:TonB family protein